MRNFYIRLLGMSINSVAHVSSKLAGAWALDVFCTPVGGQLREKDLQFLSTAKQSTINVDGNRVKVYVWPPVLDKPSIMLAHGWASNAARWRKWVLELQKQGFGVVALDAPGHGGSDGKRFTMLKYAKFIEAVVKVHKPKYFVGHSIGGGSVMFFLHHLVGTCSIDRMVLLAPPSELTVFTDKYFLMLQLNKKVRAGYEAKIVEKFGFETSYVSSAKFAQNVQIPTLVIHDPSDEINLYVEGKAVADNLPNGEMMTTEGKDHSLRGADIIAASLSFLTKI